MQNLQAPPPVHESNWFWGPLTLAVGVVVAVVGAMKHDLRGLLAIAWILLAVAIIVMSKMVKRGRWYLATALIVLVGGGLLWLNRWLSPFNATTREAAEIVPQTKPSAPVYPPATPSQNQSLGEGTKGSKPTSTPHISQGPNSALSIGQRGGITAGTINIGGGEHPHLEVTKLQKNIKVSEGRYETTFRLKVQTTTPSTIYLKATGKHNAGEIDLTPEAPTKAEGFVYENGRWSDVFSETYVRNVASGNYIVHLTSTAPDSVELTASPPPGSNGAVVGSITQGAGSIAQVGGSGNTATIINPCPPPPTVTWSEDKQQEPSLDGSHPITWGKLFVDRPFTDAKFAVLCDRSCSGYNFMVQGFNANSFAKPSDPRYSGVVVFLIGGPNPFPPHTTASFRVKSDDDKPVHIVGVKTLGVTDDSGCQR